MLTRCSIKYVLCVLEVPVGPLNDLTEVVDDCVSDRESIPILLGSMTVKYRTRYK